MPKLVISAVLAAAVAAVWSPNAHAQAWVAEKGTLSGSLNYQFNTADTIIETDIELAGDPTHVHAIVAVAEYVPIPKLAVRALVPLIFTQFKGEGTNPFFAPHGDWDDGALHGGLQDFRLDARYAVLEAPVAISPILGFSIPMSDYENKGFSGIGRHLKQLHAGINIGYAMPFLPDLYVHGMYEFTLSEKLDANADTEEFSQNYSRFGLQIGYFILPSLQVNVAANGLMRHDGINFEEWGMYTGDAKDFHDSLIKERAILLGLGAAYSINDNLGVGLSFARFMTGENTRKATLLALSLDWSWGLLDQPAQQQPAEDVAPEQGDAEAAE